MVPGHGFTALLPLMWNNVLYLDMGKNHDPKSVDTSWMLTHWPLLDPLLLAGAVDLAGMDPVFCWWWTWGNHSPL